MKESLNEDYDINCENMIDMKLEQATNGFRLSVGTFFNDGKEIEKNILEFGEQEKQIFAMSDGTFIMEDCPEGNQDGIINYYYSDNLDDLTQ